MKKIVIWLPFVLLLFAFINVRAEVPNLVLEKLSVEDGLSQGSVYSITQDKEGLLWLSSETGIDVYDGYSFRQILGPDGDFNGFPGAKTLVAENGSIWLNIIGKGLYLYDKYKNSYQFMLLNDPANKDYQVIDFIEAENSKKLWVATSKTVGLFNSENQQFKAVVDLSEVLKGYSQIYQISQHQEHLFIGTRIGVYVYHITSKKLVKLPLIVKENTSPDNFQEAEAKYAYNVSTYNNRLYIGSNDGVFSLNITDIDAFIDGHVPLPDYELIIENVSTWRFLIHQNYLYVTSEQGVNSIDLISNQGDHLFAFSDYFAKIANDTVVALTVDNNGTFWLGSEANGIIKWDPKSALVENYSYEKDKAISLSDNNVTNVLSHRTEANSLWVGTSNGLNLVNRQGKTVEHFAVDHDKSSYFSEGNIERLHYGENNTLWLVTATGLKLFDINTKTLQPLPFDDEIIQRLQTEENHSRVHQNTLWIASHDDLFAIDLTTGEIDELVELREQIGKNNIWNFFPPIDSPDDTICFTTNSTLWQFNRKTRDLKILYQQPGMLDTDWSYIDSFTIDKKNRLWLAFTGQGVIGVNLNDKTDVIEYNRLNSVIDNNVYGIKMDIEGDIWFSSHSGIYLLNMATNHIRKFDITDGLVGNEFNANAYTTLLNNAFAYGSMSGLSIFDPILLKRIRGNQQYKVAITNVELLSRDLNTSLYYENNAIVDLNYDDVGLRIDFTTFNFSSKKEVLFNYKLLGDKTVEYPSTYENYVIFPNLASGDHTLEIKAKSPITGMFSQPTYLQLQVQYAPWKSPVAYVFYGFLSFFIVLLWLIKKRQQKVSLLAAHEQVKFRENRLQLALKGSDSEVWDWTAHNNVFYAKRINEELNYQYELSSASFYTYFEHIHDDDKDNFANAWWRFVDNANLTDTFVCTYRLRRSDGKWLWYKDLGKIVELNEQNKPKRITGLYTNITQSKADEEKALFYGEAFRQTKDWVLIIDQDFTSVISNEAIRLVFDWTQEEFPFTPDLFALSLERKCFYRKVMMQLKVHEHWRGEEDIVAADGNRYHVLVNISVGVSPSGGYHYICVFTDITAQKDAEKELRYLANYDNLTGLPNRSLLLQRIEHSVHIAQQKSSNIALFFIDLDRFKQVNDTLGHDSGDILLKTVTQRLLNSLRSNDLVARLGGDEFVILIERFSNKNELSLIAKKIIQEVELPVTLKETVVSIGASIGISIYPDDGIDSNELLRNSDIAMYNAKQNGRNNYQFFEPSMNDAAIKRLTQEGKIKLAVSQKQFINYYQPVVNAYKDTPVGVEMLMRWPTDKGMVSPNEFIPLAEELGLIMQMTESALKQAFQELKKWRELQPDFYISVNISAHHFMKGSLVTVFHRLLLTYKIPAQAVRIELTETAFISEPEQAIVIMQKLNDLGIKLALDDFGQGYSSLSYLKKLPLDVIKIDRSFISSIGRTSADEAIINATILLADSLGMSCIAEGVETSEQLTYLLERKCYLIQGYFYHKPMPAEDILSLLMRDND